MILLREGKMENHAWEGKPPAPVSLQRWWSTQGGDYFQDTQLPSWATERRYKVPACPFPGLLAHDEGIRGSHFLPDTKFHMRSPSKLSQQPVGSAVFLTMLSGGDRRHASCPAKSKSHRSPMEYLKGTGNDSKNIWKEFSGQPSPHGICTSSRVQRGSGKLPFFIYHPCKLT